MVALELLASLMVSKRGPLAAGYHSILYIYMQTSKPVLWGGNVIDEQHPRYLLGQRWSGR